MTKINTTKAHVMSDLHLDLMTENDYQDFVQALTATKVGDQAELAIVAGDCTTLSPAKKHLTIKHLQMLSELYHKVIYVPGNHEFWNSSFEASYTILTEMEERFTNIHMLAWDNPCVYNGQHFIGDTMWFPKPHLNSPSIAYWPDNRNIYNFTPKAFELHEKFCKDVVANIRLDDIVVSHHFPFKESIAPEYSGDPWNCYFHADVSQYMETPPMMWIHGHTHNPFNYKTLDGTLVVCNPKGYRHEGLNEDFFNHLLISFGFNA